MNNLTISEVKNNFATIISRTGSGERFVIQQHQQPVAVLMSNIDFIHLEKVTQLAHRLVILLGQSIEVLHKIESGELHPTMAAYGLWQDEPDFVSLVDEIIENRQNQPLRTEVAYEVDG